MILFNTITFLSYITIGGAFTRTCQDIKNVFSDTSCCGILDPSAVEAPRTAREREAVILRAVAGMSENAQNALSSLHIEAPNGEEYKQAFNDDDLGTLTWSASISKQLLGILIGAAELQFSDFRIDTTNLSTCLPTDKITGTVLEHATLEDLMSMRAGLMPDYAPYEISSTSPYVTAFNITYEFQYGIAPIANLVPYDASADSAWTGTTDSLYKSLYRTDGQPLQYRIDDRRSDVDDTDRAKVYDATKPSHPAYSSIGIHLAGVCLQNVLADKHGDTSWTALRYEKWTRDTLFKPLGYSEARVSTTADGKHLLWGGFVYAPIDFYARAMELVLNGDGHFRNTDIMRPDYAAEYIDATKFELFDTSLRFYRGIFKGKSTGMLSFRGNGGQMVYGRQKRGENERHTISAIARRSNPTPAFSLAVSKLDKPLVTFVNPKEFLTLLFIFGRPEGLATDFSNSTSLVGNSRGVTLEYPVLSEFVEENMQFVDGIFETYS